MKNLLLIGIVFTFFSVSGQTLSKKLTNYTWVATAGAVKASINFEEGYDGATWGGMVIWTNVTDCLASFTYDVIGNSISTKFVQNTCGNTGGNNTFTYNESSNSISLTYNGKNQTYYAQTKTKP